MTKLALVKQAVLIGGPSHGQHISLDQGVKELVIDSGIYQKSTTARRFFPGYRWEDYEIFTYPNVKEFEISYTLSNEYIYTAFPGSVVVENEIWSKMRRRVDSELRKHPNVSQAILTKRSLLKTVSTKFSVEWLAEPAHMFPSARIEAISGIVEPVRRRAINA